MAAVRGPEAQFPESGEGSRRASPDPFFWCVSAACTLLQPLGPELAPASYAGGWAGGGSAIQRRHSRSGTPPPSPPALAILHMRDHRLSTELPEAARETSVVGTETTSAAAFCCHLPTQVVSRSCWSLFSGSTGRGAFDFLKVLIGPGEAEAQTYGVLERQHGSAHSRRWRVGGCGRRARQRGPWGGGRGASGSSSRNSGGWRTRRTEPMAAGSVMTR